MICTHAFVCGRVHYKGQLRMMTKHQPDVSIFPFFWYEMLTNGKWERIGLMHVSRELMTDELMWDELETL